MAKKLTKEQCLEWFKEPGINPITKSKIKINSKTGLYPKYEKQCAEYKNQPVKKEKSISKSSSSSSSTKQVTIKSNVNEDDINLIKEFTIHSTEPHNVVDNMDEAMIDACPKDVFNKAYFQYFVAQYMSKRTKYRSLLLYYTVGTGKTCAGVSIAESLLIGHNNFDEPPIIVILPRTLIQNFKDTIFNLHRQDVNQCTENIYKLMVDKNTTQSALDKIISKRYNIMTYSGFIKYIKNKTLSDKTIIIDEVHNLRNPDEADDDDIKKIYETVKFAIEKGKNNRLILMSGTPMYNEPDELLDLFNLLLLNENRSKISSLTDDNVKQLSKQYISYINSKNPFVYPVRLLHEDAIERDTTPDGLIPVLLNPKQVVKDGKELMKHLKYMNIAFEPVNYLKYSNGKYSYLKKEILNSEHIGEYAPKIARLCNYIKKSKGIVIIYSQYIEYGIVPLAIALEHLGYSRYVDSLSKHYNLLTDKNTTLKYAIITSENNTHLNNVGTAKNINNILKLVNSNENTNGEKLKVVLITRKASEGLSFMNVREIHILDPWYHFNRHEQIIGRGFRRCSHIKLPLEHRNLTVFVYCGYYTDRTLKNKNESPDIHAYHIAKSKLKKIRHIINIIEENAFDNKINEKLNRFPRSLFNKVNPLEIVSSQGSKIMHYFGDDKEYNHNINDKEIKSNNLRSEIMFISNRYESMIKDMMKTKNYVSYETLSKTIKDKRYLDLAINNVIFPNKVADYLLVFNNNGIQKINDLYNGNIKEIVLPTIQKKIVITKYDTVLDNFEKNYSDFELFYRFMMYINSQNWDDIAKKIISTKSKLYILLKEYCVIINDYYFDLFSTDTPIPLKSTKDEYIDLAKYEFIKQEVNNKNKYGDIGIAVKTKGVLDKNLSFKIVTSGNKGTKCESQTVDKLNKTFETKITETKLDKCIEIAKQFYKDGNLLIIPYIKMKK